MLQMPRHTAARSAYGLLGLAALALIGCQEKAEGWTLREIPDQLGGPAEVVAVHSSSIPGGGELETKASCTIGFIDFKFTYLNDAAKGEGGPSLLWNTDEEQPYVSVRTRLDDGDVVTVSSESEYKNVASVAFYDAEGFWRMMHNAVDAQAKSDGRDQATNGMWGALNHGVVNLGTSMNSAMGQKLGAGTVEAFNSATTFRAEVPLSDGRKAAATIERKNPVIQQLVETCIRKGLRAASFDRAHPQPTCTPGEKLYAADGAVAIDPNAPNDKPRRFDEGAEVVVAPHGEGLPPTICPVELPTNGSRTRIFGVARSQLHTAAEWDAAQASDRDRTWKGSVDQFEANLRRLLKKYAGELGIDPSRYEEDIAYAVKLARTCAAIPASAHRKDYTGRDRLQTTDEQKLCEKWIIVTSKQLGRPAEQDPRTLVISPNVNNLRDGTGGFSMRITVAPPEDDRRPATNFHRFGIIDAEFPPAP